MSNTWRHFARMLVVLVFLGDFIACRSNRDPVNELIAELEEAAEARDIKPFEKRLASDFTGTDEISREESLALLRRYFAAYESIHLDVMKVERAESGKAVSFHVSFSGKGKAVFNLQNLVPATASYDFVLQLVQEDGVLKVREAFWRNTSSY